MPTKTHRYRKSCIASGSIYAWALSVGDVGPKVFLNNFDSHIHTILLLILLVYLVMWDFF